ncbi:MAG: (Fe-S)-binding protein [Candidatus Alcyoniella australis]|nr:(Fe-S)-binding protein [Candidatus Alcyoniella australis]
MPENACRYCGECLSRCIYLRLDPQRAADEMRRLDCGEPTPLIDKSCVSCFACNAFCPNDADPYGRILKRFEQKYEQRGLPERARYLMPTQSRSFRTDTVAALPADERALAQQWAAAEPAGDVLYPGCNLITAPYLTQSGLLDGLCIAGSLDLCCGEMYFRMGLLKQTAAIARKLTDYYARRPIERMVFVCPAGYNMFSNVLPQRFGARFDFEKVFITDYLLEQIESGALHFDHPLNSTVTVHDSCHARVLGVGFMERVRELLALMGAQVREARHSHEEGWCCGIAAGAARQSPLDIASVAARAHLDYRRSGADQTLTYCTGCYLTLGMLGPFVPGPPVKHLLELAAQAAGRPVEDRLGARGRAMLRNVALNALPKLLSTKRFRVEEG